MPTVELPAADSDTAELPIGDSPTSKLQWGDSPTAKLPQGRKAGYDATVEMTGIAPSDGGTLREQVDRSRFTSKPASLDSTAEMPMDDLGIDLGDLEALGEGPADHEEDATLIAGTADDDATQLADFGELDATQVASRDEDQDRTRLADALGADDETRIASFDAPTRMMPGLESGEEDVESGGTSIVRRLEQSMVDLDLSELDESTMPGDTAEMTGIRKVGGDTAEMTGIRKVDLELGAPATGGNGHDDSRAEFTATEQISLDELPEMSELEPVTMSEVGTKLDLARAYVDMGDPDGARSILQEVLKEGSNSQRQEARRLLESLPGA